MLMMHSKIYQPAVENVQMTHEDLEQNFISDFRVYLLKRGCVSFDHTESYIELEVKTYFTVLIIDAQFE